LTALDEPGREHRQRRHSSDTAGFAADPSQYRVYSRSCFGEIVQAALQSVIRLAFSIALFSSIVSCATTTSLRVEDLGDIARFHTWDWLRDDGERVDAPASSHSELELQVARQIEESLSARGFRRVPGNAEVLVDFDLTIRRGVVEVARTGALQTLHSLHSSPSFEVQATRYEMRHYEIADLKIVTIDPRERSVVWRGSFAKQYGEVRSPQLNDAVAQLLARMPTPRPRVDGPRAVVRERSTDEEPSS
jgi:hypothetical protein